MKRYSLFIFLKDKHVDKFKWTNDSDDMLILIKELETWLKTIKKLNRKKI